MLDLQNHLFCVILTFRMNQAWQRTSLSTFAFTLQCECAVDTTEGAPWRWTLLECLRWTSKKERLVQKSQQTSKNTQSRRIPTTSLMSPRGWRRSTSAVPSALGFSCIENLEKHSWNSVTGKARAWLHMVVLLAVGFEAVLQGESLRCGPSHTRSVSRKLPEGYL